jgi:putative peptide zinc metalloprotease protein
MTTPAPTQQGTDEHPAGALVLLPGAELLGQSQSSGLREPPYLIRRPDGQVVQMSRLLYLVAEHARPGRDLAEVGRRAGDELELRIAPGQVRQMLQQKLHPLGVVSGPDRSVPPLERLQPMFGLRYRVGVIPRRWSTGSAACSARSSSLRWWSPSSAPCWPSTSGSPPFTGSAAGCRT